MSAPPKIVVTLRSGQVVRLSVSRRKIKAILNLLEFFEDSPIQNDVKTLQVASHETTVQAEIPLSSG